MTAAYLALLGLVGLERLVELRISRRNQLKLERLGVRKITEPHFRWMVFVHAGVSGVCRGRGTIAPPPADSFAGNCDGSSFCFHECAEMVGNPDPGGTLETWK